ncbi:SCO family protein [Neiella marina]|uniref:SCO family protein n=1 Tax=Neiella holothuriorum TaxID=2870530 RepID=A0ABS7EHV1_9GAMM|nr:SCO family protein [Neiella holothuriorum]MBW8191242.1 SCO family protein [Neiella holothuriorum]
MKNRLLFLAAAVFAGLVGFWISSSIKQNVTEKPTVVASGYGYQSDSLVVYQPQRELQPFHLTDHHQQEVNRERLQGSWTLVFLGYTFCPDICPMTLAMLNGVYPKLAEASDLPVTVLFVSADPQRDDSARLASYLEYFNPAFVAATAPHSDLFPFTRNLGLAYALYDGNNSDAYLVDHSASIVLINPAGHIHGVFKPVPVAGELPTVKASQLLEDFKRAIELP